MVLHCSSIALDGKGPTVPHPRFSDALTIEDSEADGVLCTLLKKLHIALFLLPTKEGLARG